MWAHNSEIESHGLHRLNKPEAPNFDTLKSLPHWYPLQVLNLRTSDISNEEGTKNFK